MSETTNVDTDRSDQDIDVETMEEDAAASDASDASEASDASDETPADTADTPSDTPADISDDTPADTPDDTPDDTSDHDRLEHEGDVAADYLEELLDIADLDGDLDMDVEGDRALVSIVGADLSQLVGNRGEVLDALQELTRLAIYRDTGERSRLMLDISGHRADLRRQLVEVANAAIETAQESGERQSLRAMTPFERKVVHDAVAAAGLTSESEGVEPRRHVVILPA